MLDLARIDERVVFVGSDLGAGAMSQFRREFPERCFMEGISEQHLVGFSAGLAADGFVVFLNTIATFLTRRAYEQIYVDVGLNRLPVRLLGNGAGFVYASLGPTHMAVDDIALMRQVPGMRVVMPANGEDVRQLMFESLTHPDPIYFRIGTRDSTCSRSLGASLNGLINLNSRSTSPVLLVFSAGSISAEVAGAVRDLSDRGIEVRAWHLSRLDGVEKQILEELSTCETVVTVEEHRIRGGLADYIAELASSNDIAPMQIRVGLHDERPVVAPSRESLLAHYGLDRKGLSVGLESIISSRSGP